MTSGVSAEAPAAIVLLSGGLDSATCLALAVADGFAPHALTFVYGQRHAIEVEAARRIAERNATAHTVLALPVLGGSALTGDGEVPKGRDPASISREIPSTYVPVRNTVFLAHALQLAELLEADHIYLGVNAIDYSGYPDCRPEFVDAFRRVAAVCSKRAVEVRAPTIHAPLMHMTKLDIVLRGLELGVDYGLTRSCYDPTADGAACGECDACRIRLRAFAEAGREDPAPYAPSRIRL